MLFLHFRIGSDNFALAAERVVEVIRLPDLKRVRQAPDAVAGSFGYRGRFVPAVDLCALEIGRPAQRRLSTRIIVIGHPANENVLIGLIAESATETLRLDPAEFAPFAAGPYGLVQRIELQDVLSPELMSFLGAEQVAIA